MISLILKSSEVPIGSLVLLCGAWMTEVVRSGGVDLNSVGVGVGGGVGGVWMCHAGRFARGSVPRRACACLRRKGRVCACVC